MAFARWDPIGDLLALQQHLEGTTSDASGWIPPVDLRESADRYVLVADLPGLRRDDIRIDVEDGRITLSGMRRERGACEHYHRVERGHGSFSRTLHLPVPVDVAGITADLQDGVLTVNIPKAAEAPARRIQVS